MIKASIIIPVYNHSLALSCVLESFTQQHFSKDEFEVIVVDDGSEEDIKSIVARYYESIHIRYFRNDANIGRAATRNNGIREAKGELLIFIDGDRVISPKFIYRHVNMHQSCENVVSIGNCVELFLFDDELKLKPDRLLNEIYQEKSKKLQKRKYYYQEIVNEIYDITGKTNCKEAWISLLSGNFSIKRKNAIDTGGFDEHFKVWGLENIEYGYRLIENGMKFLYDNEAVNFHIYHKQDRDSQKMLASFEYFFHKTNDQAVIRYYDFLQGKITLQKFTNGYSKCENYYISNRLGTKYKIQ